MTNKNEVATTDINNIKSSRDFVDAVGQKVGELMSEGDLILPSDYSPQNALKSAYLKLAETLDRNKQPVLKTCSKASVYNALMDMVVQGLSPAKNQCYFIAYGKQLTLLRSYKGTVATAKRFGGIEDVYAYCVYEGDLFETEYDMEESLMRIKNYEPKFENVDITKIKAAFAVLKRPGKPDYIEIMNIAQIRNAWSQGQSGGKGAHQKFTEEMAKKTVINRACKMFIDTSSDSEILADAFNRTTGNEFPNMGEDGETAENAKSNSAKEMEALLFGSDGVIDVEAEPVIDDSPEESPEFTDPNPFEGQEDVEKESEGADKDA